MTKLHEEEWGTEEVIILHRRDDGKKREREILGHAAPDMARALRFMLDAFPKATASEDEARARDAARAALVSTDKACLWRHARPHSTLPQTPPSPSASPGMGQRRGRCHRSPTQGRRGCCRRVASREFGRQTSRMHPQRQSKHLLPCFHTHRRPPRPTPSPLQMDARRGWLPHWTSCAKRRRYHAFQRASANASAPSCTSFARSTPHRS